MWSLPSRGQQGAMVMRSPELTVKNLTKSSRLNQPIRFQLQQMLLRQVMKV